MSDSPPVSLDELLRDPTDAALRAWIAAHPEPADVRALAARLPVRAAHPGARATMIALVAELCPDALVDALPAWVAPDPLEQALYALPGAALGASCAKRKASSPDSSYAAMLATATDDALGVYLRDASATLQPYEVSELGRTLAPRAATLPDWIKQAYADALVACIPRMRKHEQGGFFPYGALLDGPSVERLLRAAAKRAGLFELVLARLVAQGFAPCAAGVAALLGDKKLGRVAAAALASMGAVGVDAARAQLADPKAAALATIIVALPPADHPLWAGDQRSLPRFGRDPSVDLRAPTRALPLLRTVPATVDELAAALTEKPVRELLRPEAWADLVQILALDPHLTDLPGAHARALALGRLGLGADPDALCAALDEMRWDAAITKHYPSHGWGLGWALLWAGAGREVFVHAIGRFERCRVVEVLGARDYQFTNALKELQPDWAPSVLALLRHYGATRNETAWLGPPAVLASLASPAAEVALPTERADLWIHGCVQGASRFTVSFGGGVTITVDVAAERWSVATPAIERGATPPLDAARGVRFAIETARGGMYVGLDGAVIHGPFRDLPGKVSPVRVTAEGDGALVTELVLREKFTAREVEAAGELFTALDAAQGYTEVAGQRSAAAAHCLAAAALLLDEPRATLARDALLTMQGDAAAPWQQHVREAAAAPAAAPVEAKKPRGGAKAKPAEAAPVEPTDVVAPTAFGPRSFEDVVRVLHDLKIGVKARARKPAELRRGMTEHGGYEYATWSPTPASEDWGARGAVPYPAVYLTEEAPPFDDVEAFVDALSGLPALCRKGRGTAAEVSSCGDGGGYLVVELEITSGYEGDWFRVLGAAWKVDEGWCWALVEGDEAPLRALLGVAALPARVEWKRAGRVVVGNW